MLKGSDNFSMSATASALRQADIPWTVDGPDSPPHPNPAARAARGMALLGPASLGSQWSCLGGGAVDDEETCACFTMNAPFEDVDVEYTRERRHRSRSRSAEDRREHRDLARARRAAKSSQKRPARKRSEKCVELEHAMPSFDRGPAVVPGSPSPVCWHPFLTDKMPVAMGGEKDFRAQLRFFEKDDLDTPLPDGNTILHYAASIGDATGLALLLDAFNSAEDRKEILEKRNGAGVSVVSLSQRLSVGDPIRDEIENQAAMHAVDEAAYVDSFTPVAPRGATPYLFARLRKTFGRKRSKSLESAASSLSDASSGPI
jgi:hypothetical protein